MKVKTFLSVWSVAVLLAGWGNVPAVVAQDLSLDAQSAEPQARGPGASHLVAETLGSLPNDLDVWVLNCPAGTHHVHYDINDLGAGGPTFGIVVTDEAPPPAFVRVAPQGGLSPSGNASGGPGIYYLSVFKAGGDRTVPGGAYNSLQLCHNAAHGTLPDVAHFIAQDR